MLITSLPTAYGLTAGETSQDRGPRPRLRGRYATRLDVAQLVAELALFGLAAAVFYIAIVAFPARLLWPSATHGTPQYWAAAIALGILLLATIGHGRAAIHDDLTITHDLSDVPAYERWEHERAGSALARRAFVTDFLLAALFLYPALPVLHELWQRNDAADLATLGPQLLWRIAPIAALVVLRSVTGYGLHALADALETRQEFAEAEAAEQAQAAATTA